LCDHKLKVKTRNLHEICKISRKIRWCNQEGYFAIRAAARSLINEWVGRDVWLQPVPSATRANLPIYVRCARVLFSTCSIFSSPLARVLFLCVVFHPTKPSAIKKGKKKIAHLARRRRKEQKPEWEYFL